MSKKRAFLSPLALALAALVGTSKADAATTPAKAPRIDDPSEKTAVAPFQLPKFLTIDRNPNTGELMAYHNSHQSHSSHSSHRSHYSGR